MQGIARFTLICVTTFVLFSGAARAGWLFERDTTDGARVEKILAGEDAEHRYVFLATTDASQNGFQDLLLVDELGHVRLMLNQRGEGFAPPETIAGPVNETPGPVAIETSDVNLNNAEDIIIANSVGEVYLVLAEGRGRFRAMTRISDALNPNGGPMYIRVSDVDADNDEDIVFGNSEGTLYQIENIGMGHFGRATVIARVPNLAPGPYSFVFSDLSFNNFEDIILVDAKGTVFLIENHTGSFSAPRQITGPFSTTPGHVALGLADYDYDGDDDIVMLLGSGALVLIENMGRGAFTRPPKQIAPPLGPEGGVRQLALSDIEAETSEDFVVVNSRGSVHIVENDGRGNYGQPRTIAENIEMAHGVLTVIRDDVTADGAEDALILDAAGNLFVVYGERQLVVDHTRDLGADF